MSESLKTNTTLTELYLSGDDKRRHTKDIHQQPLFSFLITSTGINIGDTGATSLSEVLKSNTTLTKLNFGGEDKRKKTQKRRLSTIHNFSLLFTSTGNNIGDTGATSLNEPLKSNTTLTELDLGREDKRKNTHKRHPSTIHSFHFSSHQKKSVLETQEQHH